MNIAEAVDYNGRKYIYELLFNEYKRDFHFGSSAGNRHLFNKLPITEKEFIHQFISEPGEEAIQKNSSFSIESKH